MSDEKYGQSKPFDVLNTRGLANKREYVRDLQMRGDAQSLSLLTECLCDESWYLRELAEEAFLNLGENGAPVLLPLLEQGLWFTRTSTARILGRLGYRPAVPPLLRLTEDANDTAAAAARDALVAIGNQGGAIRLAHSLHRMPPDARRRRMDEIAERDRVLSDRVDRMMRNEELMSDDESDQLSDDNPAVRASEEGVEWEVLTGPPPPKPKSSVEAGGGHG
jgi:hypothetical protein